MSQIQQEIKAGTLFVFDRATGKVITGKLIANVHLNKDNAIQLDLDKDWWTKISRFKGGLGSCAPADVFENDGDDPDVIARVARIREIVKAGRIEILDPTSELLIPSELIEDISANGPAIQLTLDPGWYECREDYLHDNADDDGDNNMEQKE